MRIIISSNPENLRAENPDVTVEAEYGGVLVEGRLLTLAHHGDRGHNPPPSTRGNNPVQGCETIGISHVDLDTLGGILSVLGTKPDAPSFWELSGFVDLNGPHKLSQANASEEDLRRLYAYWAGRQEVYPPRDGSVADVTDQVNQLAELVTNVLSGDEDLLRQGDEFSRAETDLNVNSFRELLPSGIILRQSSQFANHLYVTPSGEIARAVVTHNPSEDLPGGAITASLADPIDGVNIGALLGEFFSPEAGGHANIGGSERGVARPYEDAVGFAQFLAKRLAEPAPQPPIWFGVPW